MVKITLSFLENVFGRETVNGTSALMELFEKVLYLYKRIFPSLDLGSSEMQAFSAMEFMLHAEAYLILRSPRSGKSFFNNNKGKFLEHFNYEAVIKEIDKDDTMLFLYHPRGNGQRKLSANGVIGKFHSYEQNSPSRTVHLLILAQKMLKYIRSLSTLKSVTKALLACPWMMWSILGCGMVSDWKSSYRIKGS